MQYPEPIAQLIDSYMKLPGIGQKNSDPAGFFLPLICKVMT